MNRSLVLTTIIILHQPWLIFLWLFLNNVREVLIMPLLVITSAYLQSRLRTRFSVENDGTAEVSASAWRESEGLRLGACSRDPEARINRPNLRRYIRPFG